MALVFQNATIILSSILSYLSNCARTAFTIELVSVSFTYIYKREFYEREAVNNGWTGRVI